MVWHAIPVLKFLQESWITMAAHPKFIDISDAINAGLKNLTKWYWKLDDRIRQMCISSAWVGFDM
jgi:hypothetical protein